MDQSNAKDDKRTGILWRVHKSIVAASVFRYPEMTRSEILRAEAFRNAVQRHGLTPPDDADVEVEERNEVYLVRLTWT